jgi:tol-pal system protein YbgF
MKNARTLRNRLLAAALLASVFGFAPSRAHAASKEIIELQTQVQQLLDMVQRLQSTIDSRFGALQGLVQQSVDNSNKVSAAMDALQQKIGAQNEALSGKIDSNSGQVQSVSDSLDELKARIGKLDKSIQDLQSQLQNMQAPPSGQQQQPGGSGMPAQPATPGAGSAAPGPGANAAPPLQDTYQSAVRDFNSGHSDVATGEFQEVIQYYPQDELAGNAQFYLGEIAYRQQQYSDAVKSYNTVLESFSSSPKAAAAQLHKGYALLQLNKRDAGIHELRSLIQRHPQTPEAQQARSKLNGMGVRITAAAR